MNKKLEAEFIKWAEARDDDWWEKGEGHFSVWDVRIMLEFFKEILEKVKIEPVDFPEGTGTEYGIGCYEGQAVTIRRINEKIEELTQ